MRTAGSVGERLTSEPERLRATQLEKLRAAIGVISSEVRLEGASGQSLPPRSERHSDGDLPSLTPFGSSGELIATDENLMLAAAPNSSMRSHRFLLTLVVSSAFQQAQPSLPSSESCASSCARRRQRCTGAGSRTHSRAPSDHGGLMNLNRFDLEHN